MALRPLQDRILVERLEEETKTAGGIYIPDNQTEKPSQGVVITTGPGKRNSDGTVSPIDFGEGAKILFGKYAGTEVNVEGKEYLIMKEEDVLGVFEN